MDRSVERREAKKRRLGMDQVKWVARGGVRSFTSVPRQYVPAHFGNDFGTDSRRRRRLCQDDS
jgi:hypothetical protein